MIAATLILLSLVQQPPPSVTVEGEAGFGGRYRQGHWCPVAITLANKTEHEREGTLRLLWAAPTVLQGRNPGWRDLDDRTGPVWEIPFRLPARSTHRISTVVMAPSTGLARTISLWAFAESTTGFNSPGVDLGPVPVEPQKKLIACCGRTPAGLARPDVVLASLPIDLLPEDRRGLDALDALLWTDADAGEVRSPRQVEAVRQWISCGGHFVASRAHRVGFDGTALAALFPVRLGGQSRTRPLEALAPFAGETAAPSDSALVLEIESSPGTQAVPSEGPPLFVRGFQDAGRVTFVGFDTASAPFQDWGGAMGFWTALLPIGNPVAPPDRAPHLVGSDRLMDYLTGFTTVPLPKVQKPILLLFLFLAIAGPLDYLILRRFGRLEWTWFTFPVYVIALTAALLALGSGFLRSTAFQREIVVVDHFLDSGFQRRRALEAVLAPARMRYRTDLQPLSSDYLQSGDRRSDDESMAPLVVRGTEQPPVGEWILERGATGVAISDACETRAAPMTYTLEEDDRGSWLRYESQAGPMGPAILLQPDRWIFLERLPQGSQRIRGRQIPPNPEALGRDARRLLETMWTAPPGTNVAGRLGVRDWLERGGSVLIALAPSEQGDVFLDPAPANRTSLVIRRFFGRPAP